MNELELIKERHSVRSFKNQPLTEEHIEKLNALIDEINAETGMHIQLMLGKNNVFKNFIMKFTGAADVPAYIALVGKDEDGLFEKSGYYGEKIVLFAQSLGLNTCWVGMFTRKEVTAEVREGEKVAITIMIGYGNDQGKPHKSKSISQVINQKGLPDWFIDGVEAALLAPTAINQQKFLFTLDGDKVNVSVKGHGPFIKVDLGIVAYHFEVGSGKKIFKG